MEVCCILNLWGFPIDIDAVEEAGLIDARREMAADKDVNARGYECLSIFGARVLRKVRGFAFERYENPDAWIPSLQFFELVKVAAKRGALIVGRAADARLGCVGC